MREFTSTQSSNAIGRQHSSSHLATIHHYSRLKTTKAVVAEQTCERRRSPVCASDLAEHLFVLPLPGLLRYMELRGSLRISLLRAPRCAGLHRHGKGGASRLSQTRKHVVDGADVCAAGQADIGRRGVHESDCAAKQMPK